MRHIFFDTTTQAFRFRRGGAVWILLVAAGILLSACGKEEGPTSSAPEEGDSGRYLFKGVLTDVRTASTASMLLDLQAMDGETEGSLLIQPDTIENLSFSPLSGRLDSGKLSLGNGIDPASGVDLQLTGTVHDDGTLTAVLTSLACGLRIPFSATPVPLLDLQETRAMEPPVDVLSLVQVEDKVWLSSIFNDYVVLDSTWAVTATVPVYIYEGVHWTSGSLAYGDSCFHGTYPIQTGGGSVSDIVVFADDGTLVERIRLDHAAGGLAWREGHLWSLDRARRCLDELSPEGSVIDSVAFDLPEMHGLSWGDDHFWSQSWYLPLLFRIDRSGHLDAYQPLTGWTAASYAGGVSWSARSILVNRFEVYGPCRLLELEPGS